MYLKAGFTLVEMLIVVAIIMVLATVVLGNLRPSVDKAKDAKRQSDVKQLGVAARLYHERYGSFPGGSGSQVVKAGGTNTASKALADFMKLPDDPDTVYYYNANYSCPKAGGNKVVVFAALSDTEGGNFSQICNSSLAKKWYGIIVN